jgi:hypothetical protein
MASVQCRDKESVVSAYENQGIDTWAIFFDSKNRYARGSSKEELEAALELLLQGASNSVYTLRVYDGVEVKELKTKTEPDFAINFRLNGENMPEAMSGKGTTRSQSFGIGRIQQMIEDKVVKKMLEMMEDGPAPESKLGIVGEILDHPVIGSVFEKLALNFLSPGATATAQMPVLQPHRPMQMQAVGNIATDTELVKAIEKLKTFDPLLTEHLKKLAIIAENDPGTFKIIIGSLDKMT